MINKLSDKSKKIQKEQNNRKITKILMEKIVEG